MKDLLIEIGSEEIPASFLEPAANKFAEIVGNFFNDQRISYKEIKSYYTPRRIALIVTKVLPKQREEILEIQGPPKKFAFDNDGKPTKVAEGFANTYKLRIKDLYIKATPKGEYIFAKKKAEQKSIEQLLKENVVNLISSLQFAKSMRWSDNSRLRFARPIRWLTIIYGNTPIVVNFDGIVSSNVTYAHRNASKHPIKIKAVKDYWKVLKKYDVIVRPTERREFIKKQINKLAREVRGQVVEDEELLDEATNICEMPTPLLCEFKAEYLKLPAVVLITALKTHTRCFAVKSIASDNLIPNFIAITNTPTIDKKLVSYWYEEAVEARLEDAKFYFEEDLKIGLEQRVQEEQKVIWMENLGTLFDKTSRLERIAYVIAQQLSGVNHNFLLRAAYLCKADLLTNMVREKEYTSLQGIMGGIYAQLNGEYPQVGQIIAEHYLPKSSADKLPQSMEGAILSIADKLDNIIGAFIINEIPTGSMDRFGLRRQANAIYTICLEKQIFIDLTPIMEIAISYFNKFEDKELIKKIKEFFIERAYAILSERNFKYDVINAVLALQKLNILDLSLRAQALTDFRSKEQFEALVIGQKRVSNILKGISEIGVVRTELLRESAEKDLYEEAKAKESEITQFVLKNEYAKALEILLSLRPFIDTFFDKVLVMCDDIEIRNNRLALLAYLKSLFLQVADLSEIVIL